MIAVEKKKERKKYVNFYAINELLYVFMFNFSNSRIDREIGRKYDLKMWLLHFSTQQFCFVSAVLGDLLSYLCLLWRFGTLAIYTMYYCIHSTTKFTNRSLKTGRILKLPNETDE